jgi:hypothetical protein
MLMKLTLGRTGGFDDMAVTFSVKEESVCGGSLCPLNSGSQPRCRGTKGCREEVSGVPPNIEITAF